MTWYFWVWGVISCLGILALMFLCAAGIDYFMQRRKNGEIAELNLQIAQLEKRVKLREGKIAALQKDVEELRKEANEFGRISP